jgi:hypothetical protein
MATSYGPADGPLTVRITFIMPRPKNKVWKQKPMPRYCHIKKPDLDNLVKAVLDALNGWPGVTMRRSTRCTSASWWPPAMSSRMCRSGLWKRPPHDGLRFLPIYDR